jgi:hypothetical protein
VVREARSGLDARQKKNLSEIVLRVVVKVQTSSKELDYRYRTAA